MKTRLRRKWRFTEDALARKYKQAGWDVGEIAELLKRSPMSVAARLVGNPIKRPPVEIETDYSPPEPPQRLTNDEYEEYRRENKPKPKPTPPRLAEIVRPWEPDEIDFLRKNKARYLRSTLAKKLGRTVSEIAAKVKELNL